MAQKIEITVSPDYVAKWTIVDAIRELLQNAIDAETAGHEMQISYDDDTEKLTISSKGACLTIASLLLGNTSKANDTRNIGQFGEGYKIATLVLLRNQKKVTFDNSLAKEVWRPRFIKSRRFGCDVLGFFIERSLFAGGDALKVVVEGITNQEYYEQIVPSALRLRNDWSIVDSNAYGDVINIPGVYVNGLFVRYHEPYEFGYNFEPRYIQLDRDRKLVSDFDLEWLASRMWAVSTDTAKVLSLLESNAADTRYLSSNISGSSTISTYAWERFIAKYGKNAVPVTTQQELERINKAKYRPVLVSPSLRNVIANSPLYEEPEEEDENEPISARLTAWFDNNEITDHLTREAEDEFNALVDELREFERR